MFASLFSKLPYVVWVEVYEENPVSGEYIVGEEKNILTAFSDILFWYIPRIYKQWFLKGEL